MVLVLPTCVESGSQIKLRVCKSKTQLVFTVPFAIPQKDCRQSQGCRASTRQALRYEKGSAILSTGALAAFSGAKTGRSPLDKRVVEDTRNGEWEIRVRLRENQKATKEKPRQYARGFGRSMWKFLFPVAIGFLAGIRACQFPPRYHGVGAVLGVEARGGGFISVE